MYYPTYQEPKAQKPGRYFLKCRTCLEVSVLDNVTEDRTRGLTCGICGGKVDNMGRVHRSRVVQTEERCPCDGRCTGAIGPSCDCPCGGENHGTGRVVEIVVSSTLVPTLKPGTPDRVEAAKKRAAEYCGAVAGITTTINAKWGDLFRRKRSGERLWEREYNDYNEGVGFEHELRAVNKLKTHKGRMDRLAKIKAEIEKV